MCSFYLVSPGFFIIVNNHSHLPPLTSHLSWSSSRLKGFIYCFLKQKLKPDTLYHYLSYIFLVFLLPFPRGKTRTGHSIQYMNVQYKPTTFSHHILICPYPLIHSGLSFHRSLHFTTPFKLILVLASLAHFTYMGHQHIAKTLSEICVWGCSPEEQGINSQFPTCPFRGEQTPT